MRLLKIIFFAVLIISVGTIAVLLHKDKYNQTSEIIKKYKNSQEFKKDCLVDLPLLKFEAKVNRKNFFVIFFPGDGGWRDVVDYMSKHLADNGINVVGFNTIPYFSNIKSPEKIAIDIERIITNFSSIWKIDSVVLGGYSFGAEILPFIYNHLDSISKKKVKKMFMLAPSNMADFKVSPIYYYPSANSKPVLPEMKKIDSKLFLIFCDRYRETICKCISPQSPYTIIKLNYGHLFIRHFKDISNAVLFQLKRI
jgi:type IV secretory pathway VirJ component